jgi:lipopolysaccharide assembly outer membrane protein LptD (OstA)
MKRLTLISCMAVLVLAQTPVRHGEFRFTAATANQTGPVRHLSGNVTIETDTFLLHADQADLNEDTQEILAHGDVRIKIK